MTLPVHLGLIPRPGPAVMMVPAPDLQQLTGGVPELESLAGATDLHAANLQAVLGRPGGHETDANLISWLDAIGAGPRLAQQKLHLLALTGPDPQRIHLARVGGLHPLHDLDDLSLDLRRRLVRQARQARGQRQQYSDGGQECFLCHDRLLS
jgi:hypothetical protein